MCPTSVALDFSADMPAAKADYLLEALVRDAQTTAMHIACVAILLGHSELRGEGANLQAFRSFLHDESRVSKLALRYGADSELAPEILNLLEGMHAASVTGKDDLGALLIRGAKRNALSACASHWRRIAAVALSGLDALQAPTRARLGAAYAEDSDALRAFLKEAVEGRADSLDAFGAVRLPALRQRRRAARLRVHTACELVSAAGVFAAEIRDVSTTGMGLDCHASLKLGEAVRARLPDDRELAATVVRVNGRSVGLTLDKKLSESDLLVWQGRSGGAPRALSR